MSRPVFNNSLQYFAAQNAFDRRGLGELFKIATVGSTTLGDAAEWIVRQPVNLAASSGHALGSFVNNGGLPALAGTAAIGLGVYGANSAVEQMKANLAHSHREGMYVPGGY